METTKDWIAQGLAFSLGAVLGIIVLERYDKYISHYH